MKDEQYPGPERRKNKRIRAGFIVVYNVNRPLQVCMMVEHKELHAIMLNLSEGGIALLTNFNIPISTLLSMRFILINESSHDNEERIRDIKADGEVVYSREGERDESRLGINFTQINDRDRFSITKFVRIAKMSEAVA